MNFIMSALLPLTKFYSDYAYEEEHRFQVVRGIRALAPHFEPVLPTLTALLEQANGNEGYPCAALRAIAKIGLAARTATPTVLPETTCTNSYEREFALWALVLLRASPEDTVPTFCRGSQDPCARIRGWAATGTGVCRTNSSWAIGALVLARQKHAARFGRRGDRIAEGQIEHSLDRLKAKPQPAGDRRNLNNQQREMSTPPSMTCRQFTLRLHFPRMILIGFGSARSYFLQGMGLLRFKVASGRGHPGAHLRVRDYF